MGTIKDLVDLTTQLANSVQDRKLTAELSTIQSLIFQIQSDQAIIHEANIELREERLSLKEQILDLKRENQELKTASISAPSDIPTCPNCSTVSKPFFMRPVATDFVEILNATHECPKCKYNTNALK